MRYYRDVVRTASATAQNEVDEVRWAPLEEARTLLTHEHDPKLLDRLLDSDSPSERES